MFEYFLFVGLAELTQDAKHAHEIAYNTHSTKKTKLESDIQHVSEEIKGMIFFGFFPIFLLFCSDYLFLYQELILSFNSRGTEIEIELLL